MSTSTPFRSAVISISAVVGLGAALCPPAAATAAATTTNPTTQVTAKAVVVSRADVDGDGRRDTTTLTPARAGGAAAVTVRTVTARGASSSLLVGTPWLFGTKPWFGAAGIDGASGAELVLRSGMGAHTQFFRVLSWRGGKLVNHRDPASGDITWFTDGALSIVKGYRAATVRGVRTLTASQFLLDDADSGGLKATMSGTVSTYTWKRGAWRHASTSKKRLSVESPALAAAYGWHVKGLPVD